MSDRRKGSTWPWVLFWQYLIGERRTGKDRRTEAHRIVYGCAGDCDQGRKPCNCEYGKQYK
jgi:hypothetical protein